MNLSRYVTEAVTNIAEANLKPTDVDGAVKVSSQLHQRYSEFSQHLIPALVKHMSMQGSGQAGKQQETEQERTARFARRRTTLKFLTELLLVGVYTDPSVLLTIIKQAVWIYFPLLFFNLTRHRQMRIGTMLKTGIVHCMSYH